MGSQRLKLTDDLRARHVYIIGKSGMGKTSLMTSIISQDMHRGHGLAFLDVHQDGAYDVLGLVPKHRMKDVVLFDPTLPIKPAFNILRLPYPPHKLVDDIVSVMRMFFGSWGDRMNALIRHGLLTLIADDEPRTLRDLRDFFRNPAFRDPIIARIKNQSLREFWDLEFARMPKDAPAPVLTRLSEFLTPGSPLEELFSQPENDLDFTHIMDTGKILIVNLATGLLGESESNLLGGLITAGIQQAALARAATPR